MSDPVTDAPTTPPAADPPAATDPPATDPPAADPPATDPPAKDTPTVEELLAERKKLREENAARRVSEKEAKERAEALEREKLSDAERVTKDAEADKKRADGLEARVKRAEIRSAANGKVSNADLAADLIDPSKVELDEDGQAINADALLDALIEKYPDLKAEKAEEQRTTELKKVLKDGDVVKDGEPKPQIKTTEGMTPEEIATALENGQLRDYLKT